jgi:hypothetical protein
MNPAFIDIALERMIFGSLILLSLLIAGILAAGFAYLMAIMARTKKRETMAYDMTTLEIQMPKDNEVKIDAAEQMFASFATLKKSKGWFSFADVDEALVFEIVAKKADIRFYISAPTKIVDLVEKTVYGYYPTADIKKVDEPNIFSQNGKVAFAAMKLAKDGYKPLRTFKDIPNDTLASVTSALSKMDDDEGAIIQLLIRSSKSKMKDAGKSYIKTTKKNESDPTKATFDTDQKTLEKIGDKVTKPWFDSMIRIVVSAQNEDTADAHLRNITNSFTQFNSEYNELDEAKIWFKGGFMMNFIYKFFPVFELPWAPLTSPLSSEELATLFHFPNKSVETPHITWLKAKSAPVSAEVPTEGGTFVGYGYYRGVRRPINIHKKDRMRHIYIIGKTGVGKSELG